MSEATTLQKILRFPLTRIILGGGLWVLALVLCSGLTGIIFGDDPENLRFSTTIAAAAIALYYVIFRLYEKRKLSELSLKGFVRNFILGVGISFTLLSMVVLIMYLCGSYRVISLNRIVSIVPGFAIAILSSVTEEILMRGILFRITEEKLGSFIALLISSVVFGTIHVSNPSGSVFTASCIAVEAGLLLGSAYIYSRSLWLPVGIHFAWNLFEGGFYGLPVSGVDLDSSLLTARTSGNVLLTGGSFGPEGSLLCLFLGLTASLLMLSVSRKRNKLIRPFWMKDPMPIS